MNHVSLILGMRLSGATYQTFAHNGKMKLTWKNQNKRAFILVDVKDLEKKIRKAIIHGHPRTNRPWKRIIIVVEGVYRLV